MKYHHATETERLTGGVIDDETRRGKRLVRWFWWLFVALTVWGCVFVMILIEWMKPG